MQVAEIINEFHIQSDPQLTISLVLAAISTSSILLILMMPQVSQKYFTFLILSRYKLSSVGLW